MYPFFRLFLGEYTVKLCCEDPLPFLRRLTVNKILFWSLHGGEGTWYLKTTLAHAELLLNNAAEAGIPGEIVKTKGLPFLAAKYKKRPGLLLGLILGLGLLFYSELFVWQVTVNGNLTIPTEEILAALEEQGVTVGSYIPAIPVLKVQNQFLVSFHQLSSIAINIKGTHIQVEVLERVAETPPAVHDGYCNVVASRDGIIVSAVSSAGTVIVSPGEVVEAGQILISAFSVGKRNVYRLHHAKGTVLARVYESYSRVFPTAVETKAYTGRETVRRSVSVLGRVLPSLGGTDSPYTRFDTVVEKEEVELFGFVRTPITVTRVTYKEYEKVSVTLTEARLWENAKEDLAWWLKTLGEVESYEHSFVYDEIGGGYVLNAEAAVTINIGLDMPLEAGEQPPPQVKPPEPVA